MKLYEADISGNCKWILTISVGGVSTVKSTGEITIHGRRSDLMVSFTGREADAIARQITRQRTEWRQFNAKK